MKSECNGAASLLLLVSFLPVGSLSFKGAGWAMTVVIGFAISAVYAVIAHLTIRHAFKQSAHVVYRHMMTGMAFRFILFLVALILMHELTRLPIVGFILSFIVFYIIFQIIQAKMVIKEIETRKHQ